MDCRPVSIYRRPSSPVHSMPQLLFLKVARGSGLSINPHRPDAKLPYRGAWLNIGPEMIHLMELPNPDDLHGRPEHGGRDRHFCIGIDAGGVEPLMQRLDKAGTDLADSRSLTPTHLYRKHDVHGTVYVHRRELCLSESSLSWIRFRHNVSMIMIDKPGCPD